MTNRVVRYIRDNNSIITTGTKFKKELIKFILNRRRITTHGISNQKIITIFGRNKKRRTRKHIIKMFEKNIAMTLLGFTPTTQNAIFKVKKRKHKIRILC